MPNSIKRKGAIMDIAADTAAWVAAGAAMLSVIVYAVQAWLNRQQVQMSQKQVDLGQQQLWASQSQVSVSQEQTFVLSRPLVFPFGSESPRNSSQELISIRNAGPGTALNVRGVIFGQEPSNSNEKGKPLKLLWFANPLPPGEAPVAALSLQRSPKLNGDGQIGNLHRTYSMYAPRRTQEELSRGLTPIEQRLVLTYHDVFGLKHASLFDRTYPQAWEFVAFLPNIPKDIADLAYETS